MSSHFPWPKHISLLSFAPVPPIAPSAPAFLPHRAAPNVTATAAAAPNAALASQNAVPQPAGGVAHPKL